MSPTSYIYRIVADYSSDLVYLVLSDNLIGYISPNCESLTGYSKLELEPDLESFKKIIAPESLGLWIEHVAMHQQRLLMPNSINLKLLDRNGDEHWVSHNCQQICDEDGGFVGVRGSFSDISDLMQLQDMLEKQKTFLEQLIGNAAVPVFVLDENHRIVIWNNALQDLSGLAKEEMIGTRRQWSAFYHHERPVLADLVLTGNAQENEGIYTQIKPSLHIPGALQAEGWYENLGGKRRFILFEASPIHDQQGNRIAVIETVLDMTERKLLEEELERSTAEIALQHTKLDKLFAQVEAGKREWEDTLDCITDIVLMCDTQGSIQRCNRPFIQLLNMPFEQFVGKSWATILYGLGFVIDDYKNGNGTIHDKQGVRYFDLRTFPLRNKNGVLFGNVVNIRDITEIRAINQELEAAYNHLKLVQMQAVQQEKMASVGQLAAGVAHEINNPMGFISSNLSSLAKYINKLRAFETSLVDLAGASGNTALVDEITKTKKSMKIDFILEDMQSLLEESLDGAERVRRIVQDLKSFSHVDEAELKPVSLVDNLDSTLNMVRNEIKYVADVVKQYGDLPMVTCRPQQLNQVFMNLLVNAAHAIEGHGTITVRTWQEGEVICVAITDTGKGIAPEHLNRIFEPFFTTKDVGKGTGLGLSICYDIIHKHGGEILVESAVGAGTTFTVRLPVVPPADS
ncbi:PAS domain S-box protein [Trichlorobacter lovleyi]|uniref:PAS domain S-box protein n=1 Tax=Trichlorobacter lovleyi TaxID=313985 RepID=UPI002240D72B|nr:PAS domain S-box protein [Trichlorobacter lovleyi]QOX78958.1 PAS domain S-box protein [Trichlorobacter lovleyi]